MTDAPCPLCSRDWWRCTCRSERTPDHTPSPVSLHSQVVQAIGAEVLDVTTWDAMQAGADAIMRIPLIAAAEDMYAALTQLIATRPTVIPGLAHQTAWHAAVEAWTAAGAALAHAGVDDAP